MKAGVVGAAAAALVVVATNSAHADGAILTTGNGHGFQLYDADAKKITAFFEHPYRTLDVSGRVRRNLAYDFYFGVRFNGGFQWLTDAAGSTGVEYKEQTNVVHASLHGLFGEADAYYVAPFGLRENGLVALLHAPNARGVVSLFNFHLGHRFGDFDERAGFDHESVRPDGVDALIETGPGGGAMVYLSLSPGARCDCDAPYARASAVGAIGATTSCDGNDVVPAWQASPEDGWVGVAMAFSEEASRAPALAEKLRRWSGGRSAETILRDTLAEWAAWRKPAPTSLQDDRELRVWRQSEAVLRMGQVDEEPIAGVRDNRGMILASLPPGLWHTAWVRDAAYAIVALTHSGHGDEARAGLNFFLNASRTGRYRSYTDGVDYRVSVCRYFGSGEEEADYSGMRTPNVEFDGWGLVLWAAADYVEHSGDRHWLWSATAGGRSVYDELVVGVATPLERMLEPSGIVRADSSIWEVHEERKEHFAFTTIAAAHGFAAMAALARVAGRDRDADRFEDRAQRVRVALNGQFVDTDGGLRGSIERMGNAVTSLDASVVEAIGWGLVDDGVARATLDALDALRTPNGGYRRVGGSMDAYDNDEWAFIDLRVAHASRAMGRVNAAETLLERVLGAASNHNDLVPELYNVTDKTRPIGADAGSVPMVGYGAGAVMLELLR